ncbi:MAG: hypothetical protein ABI693_32765, partial [Bryobacteraceae bacterium]
MKSAIRWAVSAVFVTGLACTHMPAQTVPPEFLDLYTMMQGSIKTFNDSTLLAWDGSKPPVIFCAELNTLNSNSGSAILAASNYLSFQREMSGLKAMGVTGVVVNIDYPLLDTA